MKMMEEMMSYIISNGEFLFVAIVCLMITLVTFIIIRALLATIPIENNSFPKEHQEKLEDLISMFPQMDKNFLYTIVKQCNGNEQLLESWIQAELSDLLETEPNIHDGQSHPNTV